jgi:hypothetical protein
MIKYLVIYFVKVRHSENDLYHLNDQRIDVGDKIESIQKFLHNSVGHMTEFLDNQIDFSQVRQNAMQKVYKEELLEQQQKQQQAEGKNNKNNSTVTVEKIIKTTNHSKKATKTVEFVDAI